VRVLTTVSWHTKKETRTYIEKEKKKTQQNNNNGERLSDGITGH